MLGIEFLVSSFELFNYSCVLICSFSVGDFWVKDKRVVDDVV